MATGDDANGLHALLAFDIVSDQMLVAEPTSDDLVDVSSSTWNPWHLGIQTRFVHEKAIWNSTSNFRGLMAMLSPIQHLSFNFPELHDCDECLFPAMVAQLRVHFHLLILFSDVSIVCKNCLDPCFL